MDWSLALSLDQLHAFIYRFKYRPCVFYSRTYVHTIFLICFCGHAMEMVLPPEHIVS